MTDFNCFVGSWPFHKLPRQTLEELTELHTSLGIKGGYVSSLESIFYNDVYESEKELYEKLKGTAYRHVVTVNPTVSASPLTLRRCISEFEVAGIRLHPLYHNYKMTSDALLPIADIAREYNLPIFINARMLDERMTYMVIPGLPDADDIKAFLAKNPDLKIVLCHFKIGEILPFTEELTTNDNIFTDTSGFRGNLFGETEFYKILKRAVYGSGYPLCSVTSGVLMLKNEIDDESVKAALFSRDTL